MIFRRVKKEKNSEKEKKDVIAWRGHEVTRIEAFSDAVFAFAITLLVVSLEVPKSFEELTVMLMGFIPFAVCFLLFFQVWTAQNLFFRRFGLHDERTITLNGMLMFSMLFFVYPLKFLWTVLFGAKSALKDPHEMVELMYIYAGGFMAVYILLGLMYRHAYSRREHLKLTPAEAHETKTCMYQFLGIASVGVLSIALASIPFRFNVMLSGISYSMIGIVVANIHKQRRKTFPQGTPGPELSDLVVDNEPIGERVES